MWSMILIVILAIVTAWIFFFRSKVDPEGKEDRQILTISGALSAAALSVTVFLCTFTVVQGYEVGVPVTFGNVGKPMNSGAHVMAPWTRVETYPTRPLTVPDVQIKARTSQGGMFTITIGARWSVDRAGARELYFQARTGDEEEITKKIVDKALGQTTQNVYSRLDNAAAINDRAGVEHKLLDELSKQLKQFGITANSIFLREVEPDKATASTIAQLTAQQQATKVAIASQQTATERAKAQRITADGLRAAAAATPPNLTPQQVQLLCLQAWERQVSEATSRGVIVYTAPCSRAPQAIAK